jgi:uncharacterized protein (TIGR02145 family)
MKKINTLWLNTLLLICGIAILTSSCQKSDENTPQSPLTVTDIDGNEYNIVTIGTQEWMVQNLKTTKYRNGDQIINITDNSEWSSITTGAYCNYENNANNTNIYGRLYNWNAVNDSRNIAPLGWHVATDADWETLIEFLGGENIAGGKLKEAGTTHWGSPNTGATNESGFTALPGGERWTDGSFDDLGNFGYWWTATSNDITKAYFYYPDDDIPNIYRKTGDKISGLSVRCIKD